MRRLFVAILLATTIATPALAQERGDDRRAEREAARAERDAARAERSARTADEPRAHRPQREERQAERAQRQAESREARAPQVELDAQRPPHERGFAPHPRDKVDRPALERAIERGRPSTEADGQLRRERPSAEERWEREGRPSLEQRRGDRDSVADWRQEQRDQARDARRERIRDRPDRLAEHQARPPRVTPPPNARPNVPAPPPPTAVKNAPAPNWATHWRGDDRYNWRDYRRRHRSMFHLGFYFDPFGWNYNRWGIGWRLWPSYYHRSYWLHDPWMYRLPYAPYPYKWVRYWNDALLVDTFTGQVVDVEYDFFW